jgi:DNA (cytosine-5)-methyltransferase 3A
MYATTDPEVARIPIIKRHRRERNMEVLSLFDGISCGQVALQRAGIDVHKYYASEIEKNAIKITQKNFPNTIQIGDVTQVKGSQYKGIDLLIGGSPCQSLSITQSQIRQHLFGKSKLFFEYIRVLEESQPKYFLFENVASMTKESKDTISELLGCEPIFINSNSFVPQERPRLYWTNIPVGNINLPECDLVLENILEPNVEEKFYYTCGHDFLGIDKSVCAILHINGHDILKRVHSPKFKCHTLTTCGGGNTQKKVLINNRPRKLTPLEYERLQGLPDNYTQGISNTARYTAIGNGWTVDVIAYILSNVEVKKVQETA